MKLRTISLLLTLASLLVFTLASCNASDLDADDGWVPAGYQLASSEHVDYDLYVPEAWVIDMSTGVLTASTTGGNISMVATSIESGTSLYSFWKEYKTQFDPAFVDFTYVTEGKDMLLSGGQVPAKQYVYTATVTGNDYKFMQVIALNNETAYIFTFTALANQYDGLIEDVEGILSYLTFDTVNLDGISTETGSGETETTAPESDTEAAA